MALQEQICKVWYTMAFLQCCLKQLDQNARKPIESTSTLPNSCWFSSMKRRTDFLQRNQELSPKHGEVNRGLFLDFSRRQDLRVTEFFWRIQPSNLPTQYQWVSAKRIMRRLCEPNARHNRGRKNAKLFSSFHRVYWLFLSEEGD